MTVPLNRPITEREIEVVREALASAPLVPAAERFGQELAELRVVGRCECGCASVDFDSGADPRAARRVADAIGLTEAGGYVGVMVWAEQERVVALEVYDLGAGPDDQTLPRPGSLQPI